MPSCSYESRSVFFLALARVRLGSIPASQVADGNRAYKAIYSFQIENVITSVFFSVGVSNWPSLVQIRIERVRETQQKS